MRNIYIIIFICVCGVSKEKKAFHGMAVTPEIVTNHLVGMDATNHQLFPPNNNSIFTSPSLSFSLVRVQGEREKAGGR